jgi:heme-degrading monooxygenase HmoA
VDPTTKKLPEPGAGGYVVATTRLNMLPEGQKLFSKHVGAILGAFEQQPGLVGYQVGFSEKCGVARTLSVWKDEESLYAFVTGGAHKAAMDDTSKMSRGLSNTTHFPVSTTADITWNAAARAIAEDDGPFY